jgi:hypothetical protein
LIKERGKKMEAKKQERRIMTISQQIRVLQDKYPGGMKKNQIIKYFGIRRNIDLTDIEYFTPPGGKQRRYPVDAVARWWLQDRVPGLDGRKRGQL